jgi:predicted enzyme related to lactoylglutathione lyase
MPVADLAKAQRFFGAVLGWQFGSPDNGHVENISAPPGGPNVSGDTGARLWFVVEDIHTAVERVRANGGTASEPVHYESGWSSDCTDDQGTIFSLSVPSAEYSA